MTQRIAYLCGEYPRATDTFIQQEVGALREAGFNIDTISIRRPAEREQAATNGNQFDHHGTFYVLPASPWRLIAAHASSCFAAPMSYLRSLVMALRIRSPGARALLYQLFYFAEAAIVVSHMRKRGLTHIHNHAPDASGYVTMLASEMGGFSFSLTIHGFGILSEPGRWNLKEKLERALFVVCVSWFARSQAMLWTDPSHWHRFHVIHCGIDPAKFEVRKQHTPGKRLLFVGRLSREKGIPVLLDALQRLKAVHPEIHLDLVGDGPLRSRIEDMIRDQDLSANASMHGYVEQSALAALLRRSDLFVMSSFAEGIPVVLMEAMASGLTVVAPNIAGIPELVAPDCAGVLFTPGNAEHLAHAVHTMLKAPETSLEFGAEGRRTVLREFHLHAETRRLATVFRSRLKGEDAPVRPDEP